MPPSGQAARQPATAQPCLVCSGAFRLNRLSAKTFDGQGVTGCSGPAFTPADVPQDLLPELNCERTSARAALAGATADSPCHTAAPGLRLALEKTWHAPLRPPPALRPNCACPARLPPAGIWNSYARADNSQQLWASIWTEASEGGICTGLSPSGWMRKAVELRDRYNPDVRRWARWARWACWAVAALPQPAWGRRQPCSGGPAGAPGAAPASAAARGWPGGRRPSG